MRNEIKKLEIQAYVAGQEAFKLGFKCAPYLNTSFMATVPNCPMGDTVGCKKRAKMYQSYINGWTFANLNREGE